MAYGVSADGAVVVGKSEIDAFRWDEASGMVALGALPLDGDFLFSVAYGVSADGSVVVGQTSSFVLTGALVTHAFRWDAVNGMLDIGDDSRGGTAGINANGVSSDGSVVTGGDSTGAYRWDAVSGKLEFGMGTTRALAASSDGSVVAGWWGFVWDAVNGVVPLGDLPGGAHWKAANAITPDGSVIVGEGIADGPLLAARGRYQNGAVVDAEVLGEGIAVGVSADGSIAVGTALWDTAHPGLARNLQNVLVNELGLDLTGWTLGFARAISADGRTIVGEGTDPDGRPQAWRAHSPVPFSEVPEPDGASSTVASLLALAGFAGCRRRGRV